MGFVNEYVSEEDIQKYKIDDLWNEFILKAHQLKMPEYRKKGKIEYDWCIDRSESCWLIKLRSLLIYVEWTGRMISGPQSEFIFFMIINTIF